MSSTGEMTSCTCALQLEDIKVVVLKVDLANQEYHKKQEMRLSFKYATVGPIGLNQDFSFT